MFLFGQESWVSDIQKRKNKPLEWWFDLFLLGNHLLPDFIIVYGTEGAKLHKTIVKKHENLSAPQNVTPTICMIVTD